MKNAAAVLAEDEFLHLKSFSNFRLKCRILRYVHSIEWKNFFVLSCPFPFNTEAWGIPYYKDTSYASLRQ